MSLIFGIILFISDKTEVTKNIDKNFSNKSAIMIGLFQVLALIPGVSRSGITMTSGRFLGFNRFDSAKISFFFLYQLYLLQVLWGCIISIKKVVLNLIS